jgi:hypothetical protein
VQQGLKTVLAVMTVMTVVTDVLTDLTALDSKKKSFLKAHKKTRRKIPSSEQVTINGKK